MDKTIQRVYFDAIDAVSDEEILVLFPNKVSGAKSTLALKKPKTPESDRIFHMTKQLEQNIRQRLVDIEAAKRYYKNKHNDYGLLICLENGDPMSPSVLEKRFKRWQTKIGKYPDIEFHGLRHSCTTYLMDLTHDNHKLVQQVTGHTNIETLFGYSHVLDQQREELQTKIEQDFYGRENNAPAQELALQLQALPPEQIALLIAAVSHVKDCDPEFVEQIFAKKNRRLPACRKNKIPGRQDAVGELLITFYSKFVFSIRIKGLRAHNKKKTLAGAKVFQIIPAKTVRL